jgi:hypothetical protein
MVEVAAETETKLLSVYIKYLHLHNLETLTTILITKLIKFNWQG